MESLNLPLHSTIVGLVVFVFMTVGFVYLNMGIDAQAMTVLPFATAFASYLTTRRLDRLAGVFPGGSARVPDGMYDAGDL